MRQMAGAKLVSRLLLLGAVIFILFVIQGRPQEKPTAKVIGLVVTMAEDEWKEEQVDALQKAAAAHGIEVISIATARTQQEQMDAIRAFVVYRVDAIVFSPVVESGWDTVLQEAKSAEIPVVTVDKALTPGWDGLETSYVGFDYDHLASQAAQQLMPVNGAVAELYGTLNSYNAREITRGFREILDEKAQKIAYSMCGDYMRSRGAEIMENLLRRDLKIRTVVSHNDAMLLGAIDALAKHHIRPGKDMVLCSFGGGQDMMQAYRAGTVNMVVHCDNTSLAEETMRTIEALWQQPNQIIRRMAQAKVLDGGGVAA